MNLCLPENDVGIIVRINFDGSNVAVLSNTVIYIPRVEFQLESTELDLEGRPSLPILVIHSTSSDPTWRATVSVLFSSGDVLIR